MGLPTVKLVADVPVKVKDNAKRIARRRGITVKDLLMQLIEEALETDRVKRKGHN